MSSLTDAQLLQHVRKMLTQVVSFPLIGDYSTMSRGDVVRLDASGTLQLAQADSAINSAVYGAVYSASADEALLLFSGKIRLVGHGVTTGQFAYLSQSTAGEVTGVAPSSGIVCRIGIAMDADNIFFKPEIGAVPGTGESLGDMLKSVYDTNNDGVVDFATLADGLSGGAAAGINTVYGKDADGNLGFKADPAGGGAGSSVGGFHDDGSITEGGFHDDGAIA